MTPLEKANELYSKFDNLFNKDFMLPIVYDNQLKECALIAVNEIIKEIDDRFLERYDATDRYFYWQEIKKEIEKL
jgi:glutathionyl-hydroquinone reductase